jgi:hypothetical protein
MPEFYIGAHATIKQLTLLTRDPRRYRTYFPALRIIAPQLCVPAVMPGAHRASRSMPRPSYGGIGASASIRWTRSFMAVRENRFVDGTMSAAAAA